ncbi:hypothetical protein A6746_04810 [Pseudomonas aeruginosa]|nr:hypothetical protein A6746_04810 [Pseudomonas aeruginosa]
MGMSDHLGLLQAFCRQRDACMIPGGLASVSGALTMTYKPDDLDYPSLAHVAWIAQCWHGSEWDSHGEREIL